MVRMSIIPAPVGLGVFIAAIVVSRIVQERALRKLDTEAKGRLVEAFAEFRLLSLLPLAALAAFYFAMSSLDGLAVGTFLAIFLPAQLVFLVVMQLLVHRKLKAASLDPQYLRVHSIARGVVLAAFVVLLLSI